MTARPTSAAETVVTGATERLVKRLSPTRARCLALRDRVYPTSEWPHVLYRTRVSELGGPGKVLLEIGCGRDATDLKQLKSSYARLIGIDLEIRPQALGERCTALVGDAHHIPLASRSVDCICMADVVEHLSDPATTLRECARVLKPGGYLVVSTVNVRFPPILLARVLPHALRQRLNYIASNTPPDDVFPAYYRANTARRLQRAAEGQGFETVALAHVSHHPRYLMFSYLVYRIGVAVEQIVRRHEVFRGVRHFLQAVFRVPPSVAGSGPVAAQGGRP